MHIKRDYPQPFFGSRRRKRNYGRMLFIFSLFVGASLLFVYIQFDALRGIALDVVGLAPTTTPRPADVATEALDLYLAGDIEGAAELFAQAVQMRPDDVNYLYEYGQILVELDDYEQANRLADSIIDFAPRDVRGFTLKTRALVWSGDESSAIPIGLTGLEMNPDFAPLHAALSRAYTGIGSWREGLDYGASAVELNPFDANAHRSYAYALSIVGENEEAIYELEQSIALQPNLTAPYFELAAQYLALDMDDEAIDVYGRVLSLEPRNAKALLRQCQAYSKVGQFDRAVGFCEDSIAADPSYSAAYFQLGMLRYNRRDFTSSLEAFQNCVTYDESNVECNYRLGLSYYYLGNCEFSWRILQDSLITAQSRIQPGSEQGEVVANIRQGLIAVSNDCPGYSAPPMPEDESDGTGES